MIEHLNPRLLVDQDGMLSCPWEGCDAVYDREDGFRVERVAIERTTDDANWSPARGVEIDKNLQLDVREEAFYCWGCKKPIDVPDLDEEQ